VDEVLRAGAEVNAVDALGDTALHIACRNGHKDIVARLLKAGADVKATNKSGAKPKLKAFKPLHAVVGDGPEEVVFALFDLGFEVTALDAKGLSPLHLAAKAGRSKIVEILIEKGCDLDQQDNRGRTPLHFASSEGHVACTTLLLEKGANVNVKTSAGTTALHWVAVGVTVGHRSLGVETQATNPS